jgi:hypothetical protein
MNVFNLISSQLGSGKAFEKQFLLLGKILY